MLYLHLIYFSKACTIVSCIHTVHCPLVRLSTYGPDHTRRQKRSRPRGHDEEVKQFSKNNWRQLAFAQLPNSADLLGNPDRHCSFAVNLPGFSIVA